MTPCRLIDQQIQIILCPEKLVSVHRNALHPIAEDLLTSEPQIPETDIFREYLSNELAYIVAKVLFSLRFFYPRPVVLKYKICLMSIQSRSY